MVDLTIIAAATIAGLSALGCVYFYTSSKVALEETKTERARIYAHKSLSESEAEMAAARVGFGSNQNEQGDIIQQLMTFAMQNPQAVAQLMGALKGGQGNNPPPPGM